MLLHRLPEEVAWYFMGFRLKSHWGQSNKFHLKELQNVLRHCTTWNGHNQNLRTAVNYRFKKQTRITIKKQTHMALQSRPSLAQFGMVHIGTAVV